MHKVTFFPLGNADCCRIDLHDGRKILFDYANTRNPDDEDDRRCDLPTILMEDLESAEKHQFDVVAFTHLDDDHVCGAPTFFYLEHAEKYQVKGRPKIGELWVPAAALVEEGPSANEKFKAVNHAYHSRHVRRHRLLRTPFGT